MRFPRMLLVRPKSFQIEHNLRYLILTSILHLTTEKENRMLHILGTRPLTLIIELKNKSPSDDFYAATRDALYLWILAITYNIKFQFAINLEYRPLRTYLYFLFHSFRGQALVGPNLIQIQMSGYIYPRT